MEFLGNSSSLFHAYVLFSDALFLLLPRLNLRGGAVPARRQSLLLSVRCQCRANATEQGFLAERLRQKINSPGFHGAHRHWDVTVAAQEYDRDPKARFGKLLLQVESA